MKREFSEGFPDAVVNAMIVDRLTELSMELDSMDLRDMPEMRDIRRKLLDKMDSFCTKVSLKVMTLEEGTSAVPLVTVSGIKREWGEP